MTDCLLPSRRNQLLIDAELPSHQAEACSAKIIELRDNLDHLLQRNRSQHPNQPDTAPSVVMWGDPLRGLSLCGSVYARGTRTQVLAVSRSALLSTPARFLWARS